MKNISVSLMITDYNGTRALPFLTPNGETCYETSLAILDYILSSRGSLDSFKSNLKLGNREAKFEIVDKEGNTYPLPYELDNNLIFKASEAALYRGNRIYIERGEKVQMVSDTEFELFKREFLDNILNDEGRSLIQNGYFSEYPDFVTKLNDYYELTMKDDMFSSSAAAAIEKSYAFSREPITIDDYLRIYPIFRESLSFNKECLELRNEKKLDETNENKRSLCYVIGNNCQPLVLKTKEKQELDDYIIEHYTSSKDIKREFEVQIKEYVMNNKEYVQKIRDLIKNQKYSGQVTILEYEKDGSFKRINDGKYLRYPVIYSKAFKDVKKLYCNIDAFRKQYEKSLKEETKLEYEGLVMKAKSDYGVLEGDLKTLMNELEQKKVQTQKEKIESLNKMKEIISTMQQLEEEDYIKNTGGHRIFSTKISREVKYARAMCIRSKFKKDLDEWAKELTASPYKYDNIRFIMRFLRMKNDYTLEKDRVDFEETVFISRTPINEEVANAEDEKEEHQETWYSEEELKEMYDDGVPYSKLDEENIHVLKEL